MKVQMHEHAVDFRHIMREEAKNWRLIGYTPDHYRIDDWPRYRDQPPGEAPDDLAKDKIHYYEFSNKADADNYMLDLAISHALREIEKKQKAAIRKQNRRREKDRITRVNKGNPHVL